MKRTTESAFETIIEAHLLQNGYVPVAGGSFDRASAIFPDMVLAFIRETQPKEWARLEALHGDRAGDQILIDLCKWMDVHGSLATLRHGFKCYGRTLYPAFFKAAHELNPELEARYAANRLGLARQLRFSPKSEKSLDLTVSLNGIPVATVELKNPFTGQTVEDGMRQYRRDRDPRDPIFDFKRRTLVHFAADTDSVLMTTRLAGNATHFLPFNKGYDHGAGNPPDPNGRNYRTAYLWEEVLERNSLLDRVVLDQQLQDTIYQFEHKHGVVRKIDERSRQLAEALEKAVPVIITTLQKFPFVSRHLLKMDEDRDASGTGTLPTRRCAVIVDEAHSSQGGETSTHLREVLGGEDLREEAKTRAVEEGRDNMEERFRSMAKRGKQANLSFFAFTATPKHKTFAVFGRDGQPTHRYTMRQAIEEAFILDVLKHYTTYAAYFGLLKACEEDPNVERKKAALALARFLRLHPYNIAQKTEVMVEHFQTVTRHKIGGKAKAMVVTGSRLEAVRYKQSFDRYIEQKRYPIKTLVAFSGTVRDDKLPDMEYTEVKMNQGIREKELPEIFATQDYQVLLVAEKYQTGFDQPLLHSMYVDKRLAGIQAVQTLSRLNRIHPFKEDTFVLDFVNDREEIREDFKTYYEGAEMGEEVDPGRMYEVKGELDASGIYLDEEVRRFCDVYFKPRQRQSVQDHKKMNAALDPAIARFNELLEEDEDAAELLRGKIQAFRNLYGFLSQIIPYQDSDMERLHVFLRHLSRKLRKRRSGPGYQFDDDVRLEYYRLQKISEDSISLRDGEAHALDGPTEVGAGEVHEESVPLSQLIDVVNERFGTDFNLADQLFFDHIVEAAISDDGMRQAAAVNPEAKFELLFRSLLDQIFIERMDQNEAIFQRYMNDDSFQRTVRNWMTAEAYRRLRSESAVTDEMTTDRGFPRALRLVEGRPEDRYVTCVPFIPLKAAAGAFGDPQQIDDDDFEWAEVETGRRLRRGMFAAQVVGKSMEPAIPNGAYCLFAARVQGTRQGKTVLVQMRDAADPESGQRYTVKRYESEKAGDGDTWQHTKITLKPVNAEFEPIILTSADEGSLQVVAEVVEVLGGET